MTQDEVHRNGRVTVQTTVDGMAEIAMRAEGSLEMRWRVSVDYAEARDLIRSCSQWREARRVSAARSSPKAPSNQERYESGTTVLFETDDGLAEIGGEPDKIVLSGDPKTSLAIVVSPAGAVELISLLGQWLVRRGESP